jgi:hypothetical protein
MSIEYSIAVYIFELVLECVCMIDSSINWDFEIDSQLSRLRRFIAIPKNIGAVILSYLVLLVC